MAGYQGGYGDPFAQITLQHALDNEHFVTVATGVTDENGNCRFYRTETTLGAHYYRVIYAGNDTLTNATSDTVTVNVGLPRTATGITASTITPSVGQSVTLIVTLKEHATWLSKPVKIWHTTNGVRYEDGTHNTVNGVYTFTQAFGTKGQRIYHAEFAGDAQYNASSGTVR